MMSCKINEIKIIIQHEIYINSIEIKKKILLNFIVYK